MTRTVVTATVDTPLPALVDEMVTYGISGVPIVDHERRLLGIVTEADLMSKPAFGGTHRGPLNVLADLLRGRERRWMLKSTGLVAGEIMTTDVKTTRPSETVRGAARRMVQDGVKRLPVVDDDRLVGIISRADVLRKMHRSDEDLQAEIAALFADPARVPETTEVDVSVVDGVVILRGSVRFPIDLPVLSAMVWRFPGVVDVQVLATAREPNPEPFVSCDYDYLRYLR
jgi:CBS domain-containing protein